MYHTPPESCRCVHWDLHREHIKLYHLLLPLDNVRLDFKIICMHILYIDAILSSSNRRTGIITYLPLCHCLMFYLLLYYSCTSSVVSVSNRTAPWAFHSDLFGSRSNSTSSNCLLQDISWLIYEIEYIKLWINREKKM